MIPGQARISKGSNNCLKVEPNLSQERRILNSIANFYHELLIRNLERFRWVYEYLEKHNIIRGDVTKFWIGLCPPLTDSQYEGRAFLKHHCDSFRTYPALLSKFERMGLIKWVGEKSQDICERFLDAFAGCITFPVYDAQGGIYGIVGRNISDSSWMSLGIEFPRWLYGIHKVQTDLEHRHTVILSQTVFDFFALYDIVNQAGINLVIATIRPEVTPEAVDILTSLAVRDFFITFNMDEHHKQQLQEMVKKRDGRVYYILDSEGEGHSTRKIREISNLCSDSFLGKILREAAEATEKIKGDNS